jgi:hypothetical protein
VFLVWSSLPVRRITFLRFVSSVAVTAIVVTSASVASAESEASVVPLPGYGGQSGAGQLARQQAGGDVASTLRQTSASGEVSADVKAAMNTRVRVAIQSGGIDGLKIHAPYLTQMDGTTYADGNCGPAALAMALGVYGHVETVHAMRESINGQTGDWNIDSGTTWHALQTAAQTRGFVVSSPFNPDGSLRTWTLDELLVEASQGRPTLVLVKYQTLPGHEQAGWYGDHYVTILGETPDGRIVYHDPAFHGVAGAYRTINRDHFVHAWAHTWSGENWTAMPVIGRG